MATVWFCSFQTNDTQGRRGRRPLRRRIGRPTVFFSFIRFSRRVAEGVDPYEIGWFVSQNNNLSFCYTQRFKHCHLRTDLTTNVVALRPLPPRKTTGRKVTRGPGGGLGGGRIEVGVTGRESTAAPRDFALSASPKLLLCLLSCQGGLSL